MSIERASILLRSICAAAVLTLAVGCATTKQTEDLLSAAGFKIVPATTAEQQARLKTLPNHKLTMVPREGKEYFVFPDAQNNVLYVGQGAQYQEYQRLREQNRLAQEQMNAEFEANWAAAWGPWGGPGW